MLRNITITVEDEVARWARKKAAEENTSVSRLVGHMLEREMRAGDEYWRAFEEWKKFKPMPIYAASRMTREEAHERRR